MIAVDRGCTVTDVAFIFTQVPTSTDLAVFVSTSNSVRLRQVIGGFAHGRRKV
jgi:hypothetical protein